MELRREGTAVLGLHWLWDVMSGEGAFGRTYSVPGGERGVVANTARVFAAARANGVPVLYTRVVFRPGYPELVTNSPLYQGARATGAFMAGRRGTEIIDELAPEPGDIVIDNDRVSGFVNSSLDFLLRNRAIDTLLLTGVATNTTVESTARQAADLGYRTVILSDCVTSDHPAAHEASLETMRVLAEVATADEVLAALTPELGGDGSR